MIYGRPDKTDDDRMRDLLKVTTPAPWKIATNYDDIVGDNGTTIVYEAYGNAMTLMDTDFIAAARDWAPEALDRLDEVRALHRSDEHATRPLCTECRKPWPCDTWEAVNTMTAYVEVIPEMKEPDSE